MYHEQVIARRIANFERANPGVKLRDVPLDRVLELSKYLAGRPNAKGQLIRPQLTVELQRFIINERAMCKASFLYFAHRYCHVQFRTGEGGIQLFRALESQMLLIRRLAADELRMYDRFDAGDMSFDGLLYFIHKARQLGFTTLCQLLLLHRALFYADYKSLSASLDDQKTQDTHAKWQLAYDRLPWWLQTPITYREKDRGKWLSNGSYTALQDFAQDAGLGQGNTWDGLHLTEVAAVPDGVCEIALENHLFPALPRSTRMLGFLESTSQGFGNWWHRSTEQARVREYGRWGYVFIPWYAERLTYSRPDIPGGWRPNEETRAHAQKCYVTSKEFMGTNVELSPEQLYWYETEREAYRKKGALASFLVNWCATPEESFQFIEHGAFDSERLVQITDRIDRAPVAYELRRPGESMERFRVLRGPDAPPTISVGPYDLVPVATDQRDEADPRGLILLFDRPKNNVLYSIGVDTAGGIVGWDRRFRKLDHEERRKDNSVASVWCLDGGRAVQVAEVAGPIAPREFTPYVLALGRLFHGVYPVDMGAPLIIEIQPAASGAQVQQQLQYEYGYYNFYQWKTFNGMEVKATNSFGWVSNLSSVRQLWVRGKDFIEAPHLPVRPRSRELLREMAACRWDPVRQRGMALEGFHDDRVSAMLFALWQLYDWSTPQVAPPQQLSSSRDQPKRAVEFQQRDLASLDDYNTACDEWMEQMASGGWKRFSR